MKYLAASLGAALLLIITVLFQNCSSDFGTAHDPQSLGARVYNWVLIYGACSVQCGTGTQTPIAAVCQDQYGNSTSDNLCLLAKPAFTPRTCQLQACGGTYSWSTSLTGGCTPTNGICGAGSQPQSVICRNSAGQQMPDSYCTATKPAVVVACQASACPPTPAPNSGFGCNPGIFDHCVIMVTTTPSGSTYQGTCEAGYAGASPCYGVCHSGASKGSGNQWYVWSDCGHAGTTTAY